MDTSDTSIVFDENGVCDQCRTYEKEILPNWDTSEQGLASLKKLAKEIQKQGSGKDFDCILGMSGGIDSSYLVYVAKEILGLRPLVFHVDGGWNSQIAVNNIEKIVDGLNLDLFTKVIDWEEMADLQLSYFKSGVPHIDTPQDHAFFATMYKFASKHKIKHILTGANFSTECIRNPLEWMYYQSDISQIKDIHKKFGTRNLKTFPLASIFWYKIWLPYFRGIKVHHPLNSIPYKKIEAMQLLQEKFDWQPYPQKHFESRFTKFYEGYWLVNRFGYDVRKVQFSSLILTGQMTRDQALLELSKPSYDENTIFKDIEFISNKLNITKLEFDKYYNLPIKTYADYKNNIKFYSLGSWILKKLGIQMGGKR
tara:strand:+ start:2691 stop:3791 length:1101 start_codon:yes stop_codon:yes gene_type:complete